MATIVDVFNVEFKVGAEWFAQHTGVVHQADAIDKAKKLWPLLFEQHGSAFRGVRITQGLPFTKVVADCNRVGALRWRGGSTTVKAMTKIDTGDRGHTLTVGTTREGMASIWNMEPRKNAAGDIERPDLNKHAHEHHWQRPDGSVYAVDSSD